MSSNLNKYQRIAGFYDLLELPFEYGLYRAIRPQLVEGLTGQVLEAGVGTGRNLPYYARGVGVLGIDSSPAMLARAARRRVRSVASIELRDMDVTSLDLPDNAFDAAVASFLFCVLADDQQLAGLRELRRVVRPGGRIRLLNFVRPRGAVGRWVAKLSEPWAAWAFGASYDRRTEEHLSEAGLEMANVRYVVNDFVKLLELRVPDPKV